MTTETTSSPKASIDAAIKARRAPASYPFPGIDGAVVLVRLLSDREIDLARIEAQRYATRSKADLSLDPEFLEREVQRQIVWRALLDPEAREGGHVSLFPSDADLRELPAAVIEALFRLYLEHQDRTCPMQRIEADKIPELTAAIVAGGPTAISSIEPSGLVRLVLSLAAHIASK